jgi:hypothetical protein
MFIGFGEINKNKFQQPKFYFKPGECQLGQSIELGKKTKPGTTAHFVLRNGQALPIMLGNVPDELTMASSVTYPG